MKNFIYVLGIVTIGAVGYLFFMKGKGGDSEPSAPAVKVIKTAPVKVEVEEDEEPEEEVVLLPTDARDKSVIEDQIYDEWVQKVQTFLTFQLKKDSFVVQRYFELREKSEKESERLEEIHDKKSDEELDEIVSKAVDIPYQLKLKVLLGDEDYGKYLKLKSDFNMRTKKRFPKYTIDVIF